MSGHFHYNKAKLAQEIPDGAKDMLRTDLEHCVWLFQARI